MCEPFCGEFAASWSGRVDHDLDEALDGCALGWGELVQAFEDVAGGEAVGDRDAGRAEGGHRDAVDGHLEGSGEAAALGPAGLVSVRKCFFDTGSTPT